MSEDLILLVPLILPQVSFYLSECHSLAPMTMADFAEKRIYLQFVALLCFLEATGSVRQSCTAPKVVAMSGPGQQGRLFALRFSDLFDFRCLC